MNFNKLFGIHCNLFLFLFFCFFVVKQLKIPNNRFQLFFVVKDLTFDIPVEMS